MNTDNQWATLSLFVSGIHKYYGSNLAVYWCRLYRLWRHDVFDVSYRRSFEMSFDVQCSWSLIFFQSMTSTSRHVLGLRLVSTSWWTRLYVMSLDRSQSHHRIQMWCQMLINCNEKWTFWFQYQYARKQGLNLSNSLG